MLPTQIDGIVRDDNGALLNVNNTALTAYKKRKKANEAVTVLQHRVDAIETKIDLILKLLTEKG